jgi:hypothetical protein
MNQIVSMLATAIAYRERLMYFGNQLLHLQRHLYLQTVDELADREFSRLMLWALQRAAIICAKVSCGMSREQFLEQIADRWEE